MEKQVVITYVERLIAEGNLEKALAVLSAYTKGNDHDVESDLLLQTAAFNRNQKDFHRGILTQSNYSMAIANVNYALTNIIKRLPDNGNHIENIFNATNQASDQPNESINQLRKILFFSANPKGTTQLRLGEELRKIKDSLAASTERDDFDLESESAVQIPTITRAMQQQEPEIVHFSGHGEGEEGIVVEDTSGGIILFPTSGLERLFKRFKGTVKCVVLNACFSREQAEVISKHGIYVVGMNKAIGDNAAIDFAVGFYQSIGEGNDFEFAFDMALINNSANIKDLNTPELWLNGQKIDM